MSRRVEVICAQKYTLSNGALSKYKFGGALEGKPTTFVLCVDADGDLRVLDNGKQNDFHLYVQEGPSRHRNERLVIAAKEDDAYLWHLRRVRHISRLPPPGKSNIYVFFRKDAGFPDGFYRAGLAYTVEEVRLPYHPSHHALTRLREILSHVDVFGRGGIAVRLRYVAGGIPTVTHVHLLPEDLSIFPPSRPLCL